jgi:hypothetical protein
MVTAVSNYNFLCPRCGHAFLEGTSFTKCPECQVPLLEAGSSTADLRKLPERLDVAALIRDALAEQQPDEDLDVPLKRAIRRKYPECAEGLQRLVSEALAMVERLRGLSRQEAAEEMGKSQSELQLGLDGKPAIRTEYPVVHTEIGLEGLSLEQRAEVHEQVEALLKSGKPISGAQIILPKAKPRAGCLPLLLICMLALLRAIAWHGSRL